MLHYILAQYSAHRTIFGSWFPPLKHSKIKYCNIYMIRFLFCMGAGSSSSVTLFFFFFCYSPVRTTSAGSGTKTNMKTSLRNDWLRRETERGEMVRRWVKIRKPRSVNLVSTSDSETFRKLLKKNLCIMSFSCIIFFFILKCLFVFMSLCLLFSSSGVCLYISDICH